ncbi:MAG: histidinol-phosphatase HisJ [Arcobacteraceae bacterium]|nr:histidinol-phosphatase HisJ [Arcobacteraceae bacterium]
MRIDLHNHTSRCNHATGTTEEYIKRAIELGIDIYGFSDHAPMYYEPEYRMSISQKSEYEKEILNLKEKYKNNIDIRIGYEVDFMSNPKYMEKSILEADVDYLIGSVHFIQEKNDLWGFDNPAYIKYYETKNIDKIWEDYFEAIAAMVKTNYFNIVGHLDLIKVFKYLPKKDIRLIAKDSMKEIKKLGMVLEINSAGLRKPIKEQYPSKELLELAYELDIPITFGSDSHSIEQIGFGYDEVSLLAKSIGYTEVVSFKNKDKSIHKF